MDLRGSTSNQDGVIRTGFIFSLEITEKLDNKMTTFNILDIGQPRLAVPSKQETNKVTLRTAPVYFVYEVSRLQYTKQSIVCLN